jgi:hypothetical protein
MPPTPGSDGPAFPAFSWRAAAGVSFSLLDDRPVLFSEVAQKIYELNQMAAYIWCGLVDHKSPEAICEDLTTLGLKLTAARNHVQRALRNWFALGLIEVEWALGEPHCFAVSVGKLAVNIRTSSERLTELLVPLFGQISAVTNGVKDTFDVVEIERQIHIFHNKVCVSRCAIEEVVPTLKAHVTEQVISSCSPDVALHAACLASSGKCLLVNGRPGAGKTTLAVHLIGAGFEYAADDVVLIAPDGCVTGLPFAPALKSGAWALIEKFRPDLHDSAVHCRLDGKRVRYLDVPRTINGGMPVGWIVFIKRVSNVPPKLVPLGQLETIGRLIDGSYAADGRLTDQAFHAIKGMLTNAKSFELQYSDAAQARNILMDLCHG